MDELAGVVEDRLHEQLDGYPAAVLAQVLLLIPHGVALFHSRGKEL